MYYFADWYFNIDTLLSALSFGPGMFIERVTLVDGAIVEQRTFAHRAITSLLITQITVDFSQSGIIVESRRPCDFDMSDKLSFVFVFQSATRWRYPCPIILAQWAMTSHLLHRKIIRKVYRAKKRLGKPKSSKMRNIKVVLPTSPSSTLKWV